MIKNSLSKVKELFNKRAVAYNQVFHKDNVYRDYVLRDLAKFCRAHDSTFHKDPRVNSMLEGRREVWLRIERYLNLSDEELIRLHQVKQGE